MFKQKKQMVKLYEEKEHALDEIRSLSAYVDMLIMTNKELSTNLQRNEKKSAS